MCVQPPECFVEKTDHIWSTYVTVAQEIKYHQWLKPNEGFRTKGEVRLTKSPNNTQYLSSPRIGVQMREFALLEGAETYGLGSWADIADHIGGFWTKDEVRQHYIGFEILELPTPFAMDLPHSGMRYRAGSGSSP